MFPEMIEPKSIQLTWPDEQASSDFAQKLALLPGLDNARVAMVGDLGAGKTTWVRYLLKHLGVQGHIKSPTYALLETYEGWHLNMPLAIYHMDFYRFNDPMEWEEAGFRDVFNARGLKLYEWPEKVVQFLQKPNLEIRLSVLSSGARKVELMFDESLAELSKFKLD
jgi:tRNA threonylcarbamoyladenosine biosynthesis protein TsaE